MIYTRSSGASEKPEPVQIAILLHTTREEAIELFNMFKFGDAEKEDEEGKQY